MYAYKIIGLIGDIKYEDYLLDIITSKSDMYDKVWVGFSLLALQSKKATEALFELIVDKKNGASHLMLRAFACGLANKKELYPIVLKNFDSKEIGKRLLATELSALFPNDNLIKQKLKKVMKTLPLYAKGWAIASLGYLNAGNLLELVIPFLDNKRLRGVSLKALVNSSSKKDRDYFYSLIEKTSPIDKDILTVLLKSNRKENIKYWFFLISNKDVADDYYFTIYRHRLIQNELIDVIA